MSDKLQTKADRWEARQAKRGEDRRKDAGENPFLRKLNEQAASPYGAKYTRESFQAEYRRATGQEPDDKTIRTWLKSGKGEGHFTAQRTYERDNVVTKFYDKDWLPILRNMSERPAHIVKIHKDADAFRSFYGPGYNQLGDDREGVVQIVPKGAEDVLPQDKKRLTKFQAVGETGFAPLLRQMKLDGTQYDLASVIRPQTRGFLGHDVFHQMASVSGIKEFDTVLGKNIMPALSIMVFGPGMYLGAYSAEKLDPEGAGKYLNRGILEFALDPSETWAGSADEKSPARTTKAVGEATGWSDQSVRQAKAVTGMVADAAGYWYAGPAYGYYAALRRASQTQSQLASGQISKDQYGEGMQSAAIQFAATGAADWASQYVQGLGMGATTTGAARIGASAAVQTGAGVAQGQTLGDAASGAAWSAASGATYTGSNALRYLIDGDYRRQVSTPTGLASALLETGAAAYGRSGLFETERFNKAAGGSGSYWEAVGSKVGLNSFQSQSVWDAKTRRPVRQAVPGSFRSGSDWSGPSRIETNYAFDPSRPEAREVTGWEAFRKNSVDFLGSSIDNSVDALTKTSPWRALTSRSDEPTINTTRF